MAERIEVSWWVAAVLVACASAAAAAEPQAGTGTGAGANAVPAAQALERLVKGNARYVENKPERPDSRPTGGTQTPIAAVVSCADARAPVEILFDQGVNDLFVVRVAGNTVGDPSSAPAPTDTVQLQSLVFAVTSLKVNLVFVLGHEECGAVKGALDQCGGSGIGPMFQNICSAVSAKPPPGPPEQRVRATVAANVQSQVALLKRTPPFADLVKQGTLKVAGGVYDLKTGKVTLTAP
ncbi:MAG TPA: carbonic anhydrase [Myxococcales bacterium]|nr:carbonic anhydrase [Myxococcales bacterium]